jgi:hypothetical protein
MKFIWPNNAALLTYSSEFASAPAINVTQRNSLRAWLADTSDASPSVTVEVSGGNAALIYNISADACTVAIQTAAGSTIQSENHTLLGASVLGVPQRQRHVWVEYPTQTAHRIQVSLTRGTQAFAGIGVIFAGTAMGPFPTPIYGELSEETEDHSTILQLAGGVEHPIADNRQRVHPATLTARDDAVFWPLIDMGQMIGTAEPFACQMLADSAVSIPVNHRLIYARFESPPSALPAKYANKAKFTMREFL